MPLAFMTTILRPTGQAPAIGASRIGARSSKRRQKRSARSSDSFFVLAAAPSDMDVSVSRDLTGVNIPISDSSRSGYTQW